MTLNQLKLLYTYPYCAFPFWYGMYSRDTTDLIDLLSYATQYFFDLAIITIVLTLVENSYSFIVLVVRDLHLYQTNPECHGISTMIYATLVCSPNRWRRQSWNHHIYFIKRLADFDCGFKLWVQKRNDCGFHWLQWSHFILSSHFAVNKVT